jgi:hypothetical protein
MALDSAASIALRPRQKEKSTRRDESRIGSDLGLERFEWTGSSIARSTGRSNTAVIADSAQANHGRMRTGAGKEAPWFAAWLSKSIAHRRISSPKSFRESHMHHFSMRPKWRVDQRWSYRFKSSGNCHSSWHWRWTVADNHIRGGLCHSIC